MLVPPWLEDVRLSTGSIGSRDARSGHLTRALAGHGFPNFVRRSARSLARRVIGMLAPPASLARWGVPKVPTRLDRRSDNFLGSASTYERVNDRIKHGGNRQRTSPPQDSFSSPVAWGLGASNTPCPLFRSINPRS